MTTIPCANDPVLDFLNLRFGMFIHFNMGTFHGQEWATPDHDPKSFAPARLDCNQWAAAAKAARMTYGILTTKHLDGFCLWDSKVTDYDVGSSSYRGDIVREYVDAFRAAGLKVGLYYSIWDRRAGIEAGAVTRQRVDFMKTQLTELLTQYGPINCIVTDSWDSKWGGPTYRELPFHVLADHVHSIQPNCLLSNHSCRADLRYTQLVQYEATHGQHVPYDNTLPGQQGQILQPKWFWNKGFESAPLRSVADAVGELDCCNRSYCNYLLNAAPNDAGLMDANVVERLAEIGRAVTLPPAYTSLPTQAPPHRAVTIAASSQSPGEECAPRNVLDLDLFTRWLAAEGDDHAWLEIDFGRPETFNYISMHGGSQAAIQEYAIEAWLSGGWQVICRGGPITFTERRGFPEVTAQRYRLRTLQCRATPEIVELTLVRY